MKLAILTLTLSCGLLAQNQGGIIPQIADGGGWSTTFYFVNATEYYVDVELTLYDDSGNILYLPFINGGEGPPTTLPPRSTISMQTAGTSQTFTQGWALATANGIAPGSNTSGVIVTATLHFSAPGVPRQDIGIQGMNAGNPTILAFDNTGGYSTGVAVVFPGIGICDVTINIYYPNGVLAETSSLVLDTQQHTTFILTDLVPATKSATGTLEIYGLYNTNGAGTCSLSVVGISAYGYAFTAVPATLLNLSNPANY